MTEEKFKEIETEFLKKKNLEYQISIIRNVVTEWKARIIKSDFIFYVAWEGGKREILLATVDKHLLALEKELIGGLQDEFEKQTEKVASI